MSEEPYKVCSNNIDLIYQEEWDENFKPDIFVSYMNEEYKITHVYCGQSETLSKLLEGESNLLAAWVIPDPDAIIDENGKIIYPDSDEHIMSGEISKVERYRQIFYQDLYTDNSAQLLNRPGHYIAVPLFKRRVGNINASYGQSDQHGQEPDIQIYYIIRKEEFLLDAISRIYHELYHIKTDEEAPGGSYNLKDIANLQITYPYAKYDQLVYWYHQSGDEAVYDNEAESDHIQYINTKIYDALYRIYSTGDTLYLIDYRYDIGNSQDTHLDARNLGGVLDYIPVLREEYLYNQNFRDKIDGYINPDNLLIGETIYMINKVLGEACILDSNTNILIGSCLKVGVPSEYKIISDWSEQEDDYILGLISEINMSHRELFLDFCHLKRENYSMLDFSIDLAATIYQLRSQNQYLRIESDITGVISWGIDDSPNGYSLMYYSQKIELIDDIRLFADNDDEFFNFIRENRAQVIDNDTMIVTLAKIFDTNFVIGFESDQLNGYRYCSHDSCDISFANYDDLIDFFLNDEALILLYLLDDNFNKLIEDNRTFSGLHEFHLTSPNQEPQDFYYEF